MCTPSQMTVDRSAEQSAAYKTSRDGKIGETEVRRVSVSRANAHCAEGMALASSLPTQMCLLKVTIAVRSGGRCLWSWILGMLRQEDQELKDNLRNLDSKTLDSTKMK